MNKLGKITFVSIALTVCGCGSNGAKFEAERIEIDYSNAPHYFLSNAGYSTKGLVITAYDKDGKSKILNEKDYTFEAPKLAPAGEKNVTFNYQNCSASYKIHAFARASDDEAPNDVYTIGKNVNLTCYNKHENKPFVLILPGGGYTNCATTVEGYPYAEKINELGYNAFVLQYSVGSQATYPAPLDDVNFSIGAIIDNKDYFKIQSEDYAVIGSSAGGHLAALWSTKNVGYQHYNLPKPKACLLCYAVTGLDSSEKSRLVPENASEQLINDLTPINNVDKDFPQTFLWQFDNDDQVNISNLYAMEKALNDAGVKKETHIYSGEGLTGSTHGLGLAKGTVADGWMELAINFWRN